MRPQVGDVITLHATEGQNEEAKLLGDMDVTIVASLGWAELFEVSHESGMTGLVALKANGMYWTLVPIDDDEEPL